MDTKIEFIEGGSVTSPQGFHAGAAVAGIKGNTIDKPDVGILFSRELCLVAGLLTNSRIKSAPVLLCQECLQRGRALAVVVNSGCANASTGEAGINDAREMAAITAKAVGADPEGVLVASTGVIGRRLPMEKLKEGLEHISLSDSGGHDLARAMMETRSLLARS